MFAASRPLLLKDGLLSRPCPARSVAISPRRPPRKRTGTRHGEELDGRAPARVGHVGLRASRREMVGAGEVGVSVRAAERTSGALGALQALGVPVVCSAAVNVSRVGMAAAWLAADHRFVGECANVHDRAISERAAPPLERALHFATWLVHHPEV